MNPLLLNPAMMSFELPGVLGGILLPGRKGEGPTCGNGDCVLLDGSMGLAGIADGSERSPQASREFLKGMSDRLSKKDLGRGEALFRAFLDAAQAVLDSFRYEDRTTFVCVLVPGDGSIHYLCGGDSLLFHLDPGEGRIRFRNRANMGFAGRSTRVPDSGCIQVKPGELILLATDGVWDLTDGDSENLTRAFFESLRKGPFCRAVERLARDRHPAFAEKGGAEGCLSATASYDDFCAVLIDPCRMNRFPCRLIAGGTSDAAEVRYRNQCRRLAYPDRHVPVAERDQALWTFPEDLHLLVDP